MPIESCGFWLMSSILKRDVTVDANQASVGQTPIDRVNAVQHIRPGSDLTARDKV